MKDLRPQGVNGILPGTKLAVQGPEREAQCRVIEETFINFGVVKISLLSLLSESLVRVLKAAAPHLVSLVKRLTDDHEGIREGEQGVFQNVMFISKGDTKANHDARTKAGRRRVKAGIIIQTDGAQRRQLKHRTIRKLKKANALEKADAYKVACSAAAAWGEYSVKSPPPHCKWYELPGLEEDLNKPGHLPIKEAVRLYEFIIAELAVIIESLINDIFGLQEPKYRIQHKTMMINESAKHFGTAIGLPRLPQMMHCDVEPVAPGVRGPILVMFALEWLQLLVAAGSQFSTRRMAATRIQLRVDEAAKAWDAASLEGMQAAEVGCHVVLPLPVLPRCTTIVLPSPVLPVLPVYCQYCQCTDSVLALYCLPS